MPKVVIHYQGTRYETSVPSGLHVLLGGFNVGLDEFGYGDCGGNCICASCHVRVKSGNFPPMKADEKYLLDTLPHVHADSRLSCQLVVKEDCEVEWVGNL